MKRLLSILMLGMFLMSSVAYAADATMPAKKHGKHHGKKKVAATAATTAPAK